MAGDKKISELGAAPNPIDGTEEIVFVQDDVTYKGTFQDLIDLILASNLDFLGDINMATAGALFKIRSGTDQRGGNATLVAGTITVANTSITANSIVLYARKTIGGVAGNLSYTLNAGVGFTINSSNVADISTVSYFIIELV